jgi:hypothetical protein
MFRMEILDASQHHPSLQALRRLLMLPELRITLAMFILPIVTLKNAALLAFIGTILMTALLVWTFAFNILNTLRGVVPAVTMFSSFIYAFGCFSVTMFFYVFHRSQS